MKYHPRTAHWARVLLLCASLPAFGAVSHAEPFIRDEVMSQEITQPLNTATTDDYLVDLARFGNVSVIADSTDFPVGVPVNAYPSSPAAIAGVQGKDSVSWKPILINLMGELAAQKKLSTLRPDAHTFLFWSEPDPRQLFDLQLVLTEAADVARFAQIAADARENGVAEKDIVRGELPDSELMSLFRDYLRDVHGWAGSVADRNNHVDIAVRFNDLPPVLRALSLLELRQQLIAPKMLQMMQDEFWSSKERRILAREEGGKMVLEIPYITTSEDGKSSSRTFYSLPIPAEDPPPNAPVTPVENISLPNVAQLIQQGNTEGTKQGLTTVSQALTEAYQGISDEVSSPALDADPALQGLISLEAKRVPLSELLVQLQQQSGVQLIMGKDRVPDSAQKVTARVDKMPLSRFMAILTRLYGVQWTKSEDKSYILQNSDQGELHRKLIKIGDPREYLSNTELFYRSQRQQERDAITNAVVQQLGLTALQTTEGVPLSQLSPALQKQLRYVLQQPEIESLSTRLYQMNRLFTAPFATDELFLRFGNSRSNMYQNPVMSFGTGETPEFLRFSVQNKDASMTVPVFDPLLLFVASPGEKDMPIAKPGRRR